MNRRTRLALELLQKHEWAYLTNGATTVDGRGKSAKLFINAKSAQALIDRGFAEKTDATEEITVLDITLAGAEAKA